jgi:hypothetical protein
MGINFKESSVSTIFVWRSVLLRLGHLVGALAITLSVGACSQNSWKEEALQPDGSTIIVTRTVDRGGRHEVGQKPPIKTQSIEFNLPSSNEKIVWQDNFSEDLGGASFLPKLVGVSNGQAYLLATPMGCLSYNKWGRPNPPYVIFKYIDKQWNRVDLKEFPLEFKAPNLVPSNPDVDAKKTGESPVSAKTIANMVSEYQQPELKGILREKVNYDPECIPMVSNKKGQWRSTAFFTRLPTLEACELACYQEQFDETHCPCKELFKRK